MATESIVQPTEHHLSTDPSISVVICTYNRADRLKLALDALSTQSLSSEKFEILVVDNRSTDHTASICQTFQAHRSNFTYIYEPVQGLSKARNTGWQAAKGAYIAYLDDDAIPCQDWLTVILDSFETIKPQPVSIGGPIFPLWEIPRPNWLTSEMEELFTILDGGETPRWFREHEYPWGANVIYRRDALAQAGGFCEQLGRKGKHLLSGEETLLNEKLRSQGERFYFSPQASVSHWVPKERINPQWLIQRSYWQGYSVALVDNILGKSALYQRFSSVWHLLKSTIYLPKVIIRFLSSSREVTLVEQVQLMLSWQLGYFSKVWRDS